MELTKIPELIHHYLEHQDETGELSFLEFIHQHYSEEHTPKDANHKHCDLPFKTHEQGSVFYHFTFASVSNEILNPFGDAQNVYLDPSNIFLFSNYLASIWQPPQLS